MLPGVGVFGTGKMVKILVPCLRGRGFRVEAIWGRTVESAEAVAHELGIPFYTGVVDDLLLRKGVDLVYIVCPPHLHAQIAAKALGIGKHVICDRPAGLCQREVLKMVRAAQYYPLLISVICHSLRFLPAFIHMKKAIQDGYIGEVKLCDVRVQCGSLLHDHYDWMCDGTMAGGLLSNIGSHVIDILNYLTGQKAIRVHGMLKTFTKTNEFIKGIRQITSDDFCSFEMELDKGSCATVVLNNHIPSQFIQEILVCGTAGHVVVKGSDLYGRKNDSLKEEALYLDVEDSKYTSSLLPKSSSQSTLASMMSDNIQNRLNVILPKPYMKGLIKLISALKEAFTSAEDRNNWNKEPVAMAASFEDGHYIQAVIDAIRESSETRSWIKVELHTEEIDPINPLLSSLLRRNTYSL